LVCKTVSQFLLPELQKQFIDEIYSAIRRMYAGKDTAPIRSNLIKPFNQIRTEVIGEKKQIKRELSSTRLRDNMIKGERKLRDQKKSDLINQVKQYFSENEPNLRPYTFLQHYSFIGKQSFNLIYQLIGSSQARFNDVKDLFLLSTKINFVLNIYFHKLKETLQNLIPLSKDDSFRGIIEKTPYYKSIKT